MSIEIKLARFNRIYRSNEPLEGKIIMKLTSSISFQSIRLTVNGTVSLQVRGGSAGVVESFYGVIKPIPIVNKIFEVQSSGKIGSGTTEYPFAEATCKYVRRLCRTKYNLSLVSIPFSVTLKDPKEENREKFYDTYHGGNVNIQYLVTVDVVRGYLHKSLSATIEFIIESENGNLPLKPVSPEMVFFYITQDTQKHLLLPELKSGGFRVTGKICTQCSLSDPIVGELTVEASAIPVQSIDIHILRVESILTGEKIVTESSLIQTTQIVDGDVCRSMKLPIYVILPRLLTCPTIFAGPFSVEFKVTIAITFQSELSKKHSTYDPKTPRQWLALESVPLELVRTK